MPAASGLYHTRIVWQASPQRFRDSKLRSTPVALYRLQIYRFSI